MLYGSRNQHHTSFYLMSSRCSSSTSNLTGKPANATADLSYTKGVERCTRYVVKVYRWSLVFRSKLFFLHRHDNNPHDNVLAEEKYQ